MDSFNIPAPSSTRPRTAYNNTHASRIRLHTTVHRYKFSPGEDVSERAATRRHAGRMK